MARTFTVLSTVGLTVVSLLAMSACTGGGGAAASAPVVVQVTPKSALQLKSFKQDCSDFLTYVTESLTEQYLTPYRCLGDFAICPLIEALSAHASSNASAGGAESAPQPVRVSQTNVQEAGVDEADIVKADAQGNLYILSGQTLSSIAAFPAAGLQSRALNNFSFGDRTTGFYARDFFLDESARRLVVLGDQYTQSGSQAVTVLLDVSNPAQPVETGRLSVQGYGLEARRIGARVHRVIRSDIRQPDFMYSSGDALNARRNAYFSALGNNDTAAAQTIKNEIRADIANRVSAAGAASFLPELRSTLSGVSSTTALSCASIARPDVTLGMGFAVIDSFNTDGSARASSAVVNNSALVYASSGNLYLTQSSSGWVFGPVLPFTRNFLETVIYRLSLSPTGAAAYQGLAKIPGVVLNAYALSEHAGHLRVASTDDGVFSGIQQPQPTNNLTILRANQPGDLVEVSAIKGLAPGERIQGARFVGDRGYVVTFRRIDPLFAFDLSNPASPALRSSLKIPGFSSYLSPVGEGYLLTIGRAGDDQGLTGQVQVSLFDVRDLSNVRQVATLSPAAGPSSFSYSPAEYDPHAFSYFSDSANSASPGTLSIPVQTNGNASSENFAGFLVLRVNPASATPLSEVGRIDHQSFASGQQQTCSGGSRPPSGEVASATAPCFDAIYSTEPRRSVFIQDSSGATVLYTISALGLLASNATNPAQELGRKPLPYDPPCCYAVATSGGGGTSTSPANP